MKIVVTGANGLVGGELCNALERGHHEVTRVVRRSVEPGYLNVGSIDGQTDWSSVLSPSVDAVVHLAARVHVMRDDGDGFTELYRKVNTDGTLNLAKQCSVNGIKRFVFVSTVKVLGEGRDRPYQEGDAASPLGPYAVSKWEAEKGLLEISAQTGMEVVILRPPLVYGPGVGANFLRLISLVGCGIPLPFGSIHNLRSLIFLGNLVDAILVCLTHPAASGKTYLVSDGEDVSTPQLIKHLSFALGKSRHLLPVPSGWLRAFGKLLGREAAVARLLGSLIIDSTQIQKDLGWRPPWTLQAGLEETAAWYLQQKRANRGIGVKRMFDITLAFCAGFVLLLPISIAALLVGLTSSGPVLYWSDRIGRNNRLFKMPKFRSMRVDTPAVATHLLANPEVYLTPIGGFLRKSSLDELPQLWSILKGDMSFVGPRPALFNQDDLVALRTEHGVEQLVPGLTGWAQINGRDELPIPEKVLLDVEYLQRRSFLFDLQILWLTFKKVIRREGVTH